MLEGHAVRAPTPSRQRPFPPPPRVGATGGWLAGWMDGPQYLSSSVRWHPSSSASRSRMSCERWTAGLAVARCPADPPGSQLGGHMGPQAWSQVEDGACWGFAAKAPNPAKALEDTRRGRGVPHCGTHCGPDPQNPLGGPLRGPSLQRG